MSEFLLPAYEDIYFIKEGIMMFYIKCLLSRNFMYCLHFQIIQLFLKSVGIFVPIAYSFIQQTSIPCMPAVCQALASPVVKMMICCNQRLIGVSGFLSSISGVSRPGSEEEGKACHLSLSGPTVVSLLVLHLLLSQSLSSHLK